MIQLTAPLQDTMEHETRFLADRLSRVVKSCEEQVNNHSFFWCEDFMAVSYLIHNFHLLAFLSQEESEG